MYGKLSNGKIIEAPTDLVDEFGKLIYKNFNKDISILKHHGFKLVVKEVPDYDEATQDIYIDSYVEDDEEIIINYSVKEKDIPPTESQTIKAQLDSLKAEQELTNMAVQELILTQLGLL